MCKSRNKITNLVQYFYLSGMNEIYMIHVMKCELNNFDNFACKLDVLMFALKLVHHNIKLYDKIYFNNLTF